MRAALPSIPLVVRVGTRRFPFQTLEIASAAYRHAIDASGATSSGETGPAAPRCTIEDGEGNIHASISYNGKVWAGDYLKRDMRGPDVQPIFNPYEVQS